MKIIICDDEKAYVDDIKANIAVFMQERYVDVSFDTFTDGEEVLQNCNKKYDMAFLDIEMGSVKGTEIAAKLKETNHNIVIFIITAFEQYLDEAMDLNVLRFIKKPLDVKRLYCGLRKALEIMDNTISGSVYLEKDKSIVQVNLSDIVYVEVSRKGTSVFTYDNEYTSNYRINFWQDKLKSSCFFKTHSSYIVNVNYITKYDREFLELDNKHKVPISYRNQANFKKFFINHLNGI